MNMKLFLLTILSFLLVVGITEAAITSTAVTTAIEDVAYTYNVQSDEETAATGTYALTVKPTGMTINANTGVISWTPTNDHVGSNSVTVNIGTSSQSFTITVSNVNDAPTVGTIATQTWPGSFPWNLDLSTVFSDVDVGDTLTYTHTVIGATATTGIEVTTTISGSTATFSFTDNDFVGDNTVKFTATDTSGATITSNDIILRKDQPSYCDVSDERNIKIGDLDFDDEDYHIFDTVSIDVSDVEALVDLEDLDVEVFLYNVDKKQKIDSWDAEEKLDLDKNEKEDFSVEFEVPNDKDVGSKDDYLLIAVAKADEADSNDNQCVQKSESITIEREDHDVVVTDVKVVPLTLSCGDTVSISVDVENIGTKNEDDVFVDLVDTELGWNERSREVDLKKFSSSDNDANIRFTLTIPANAKERTYELNPRVFFDDGDQSNEGFVTLTVSGCKPVTPETLTLDLTVRSDTEIKAGQDTANLHLIANNNEGRDLNVLLDLRPVGNWTNPVSDQAVTLHLGENNLYLDLDLNEVTKGTKTLVVSVKPATAGEFVTKEFNLNFDVTEEGLEKVTGAVVGGLKGSTLFWIIGDIVLVIVAIFFIKMIFFGRK